VAWQEYEDLPLKSGEVRIQSTFGVEKHGTMMAFYKGYANDRGAWDPEALLHRTGQGALWHYPIPLGNMQTGHVIESSSEHFKVGDQVFASMGFRPTGSVSEIDCWHLQHTVRKQDALLLDPAEFALGALRDGNFRIGDRLAVFGMGAIGLVTVQLAISAGAELVVAIDPLKRRRDAAIQCGAGAVIDPIGTDVGLAIREIAKGGVDVVIDFSGSASALQAALRGVGYLGTIVFGAFPPPFDAGLDFGGEAHMNRPRIVFSRACSDPNPDHPRWSHRRIQEACYHLINSGKLNGDPIIGPIVAFEDLMEEYPKIATDPDRGVKLAVTYS
jgi:threonine dehydrogenase-like Zn-dependent dehydrogenase